MKFSTIDAENDIDTTRNCAVDFTGGWWYKACFVFFFLILIY